MSKQISSIVKTYNFHLQNISRVCKYLTTKACQPAVQGLVVSQMDYCCSLLSGAPINQIQSLQRVQNNSARIISRVGHSNRISSVLAALHWLPCDLRLKFRILTYVHVRGFISFHQVISLQELFTSTSITGLSDHPLIHPL
ncbi:hypothetical protein HOLleu_39880 [Holothuria leucospilota]|uniref:Uncharacterized protein n=1 Tax=Holothuria leucospilota TaxID=206669 RepID=A0A9Q1BB94_HOLLE|nr:hypothetical protein HOLleu_39880 [Holothuria leucospilota]